MICDHPECEAPAERGERFCRPHADTLRLIFSTLDVRCPRCDAPAPEGLFRHDCASPTPPHPEHEGG